MQMRPQPTHSPQARFSLQAWIFKGMLIYFSLLPVAAAGLYRFYPRMPHITEMMESAGPFALFFVARTTLILATLWAGPAAFALSFLKNRQAGLAVALVYLVLSVVLIWNLSLR